MSSLSRGRSLNRLEALFSSLRKEHRCGLIAYVTCGDPDADTTVEIVRALDRAGVDAIELGVPFSDPIADGPVIQAASQRALAKGASIRDLFRIAREVRRESQIPLIAFSYLNPIFRFGTERFAGECAASEIDAALVTDLPPESSEPLRSQLRERMIGRIFLLAPTSSDARVKIVDRESDPFVYYVSTTGVTGTRKDLDPDLLANLQRVKGKLRKPMAVGFGVSTREHFVALEKYADAIVVGSRIVQAIAEGDAADAPSRAAAVVRELLGTSQPELQRSR